MKQQTLAMAVDQSFENDRKLTPRSKFLRAPQAILPWTDLCLVIELHCSKAGNGHSLAGLGPTLRLHFIQYWFNLADLSRKEALYNSASLRRFVGIDLDCESMNDATTILKFRKLLNQHKLF